jgi:hypothetical protein
MSKSIPETNAHQFSFHCNPDGAVRLDDKSDLHSSPRLLEFQTSAHKSLSLVSSRIIISRVLPNFTAIHQSYRTGGAVCTPADPVHAGSANRRAVRRGRDELSAGEAAVPHSSPMVSDQNSPKNNKSHSVSRRRLSVRERTKQSKHSFPASSPYLVVARRPL